MTEHIDPQLAIRRLIAGRLASLALVDPEGKLRGQVYWPPEGRNTPPEVVEQMAATLRHVADSSDVPLEVVEITPDDARNYLDNLPADALNTGETS